MEVCVAEGVPLVVTFWGDPVPFVERARGSATKVFHQVGSLSEARRAAAAGSLR